MHFGMLCRMSVILAYVPRPVGEAAATVAIEEARVRGTELVVANARRGGALVEGSVADPGTLESLAGRAREAGIETRVAQVDDPDVVDALMDLASGDDDMIVIGLRRRSAVGKLLLGSTAQRLLLDATCPVLTVKPRG